MALVFQCDTIQNARKYNQNWNWLEGKFNVPEKLRCFKCFRSVPVSLAVETRALHFSYQLREESGLEGM